MVDVNTQNRYITQVLSKMPEEQRGEAHVLKQGESLWSIAKKAVSVNGRAKNSDINEYMLRIAKLNGLNSYEKMNNIKPKTTIYLPKNNTQPAQRTTSAATSPTQRTTPRPAQRTSAESSAVGLVKTLTGNKNIYAEKPLFTSYNSTLYHVYVPAANGTRRSIMSFNMDKNGHLLGMSFDDAKQDLIQIRHDYIMDKSGKIILDKYPKPEVGQLTPEEFKQLEQILNNLRTK